MKTQTKTKAKKDEFKEKYLDSVEDGRRDIEMPRFYIPEWDKEQLV